jgi:putative SOS response-associated peptidase YedK
MRWGMPLPLRTGGPPVTNIRNTLITALADLAQAGKTGASSPISFAEYAPEPNPETKKKDVVWLALKEDRPLFAFAG